MTFFVEKKKVYLKNDEQVCNLFFFWGGGYFYTFFNLSLTASVDPRRPFLSTLTLISSSSSSFPLMSLNLVWWGLCSKQPKINLPGPYGVFPNRKLAKICSYPARSSGYLPNCNTQYNIQTQKYMYNLPKHTIKRIQRVYHCLHYLQWWSIFLKMRQSQLLGVFQQQQKPNKQIN